MGGRKVIAAASFFVCRSSLQLKKGTTMGLFKSKEDKEAAQETKINELLERQGLNIYDYTPEQIRQKNADNIKRINKGLVSHVLAKTSMALSLAKAEEQAKVSYLNALVEQNWIIIRQNEAILQRLGQLK
jgi:hypothetical protein